MRRKNEKYFSAELTFVVFCSGIRTESNLTDLHMTNKSNTQYSVAITYAYSSPIEQPSLGSSHYYSSNDSRMNLVSSSARAINLYGNWSGSGGYLQFKASIFESPPPDLFADAAGYRPRV